MYDDAICAMAKDALKFVKDGQTLGLGSGRAATAFVKVLSKHIKKQNIRIVGIPTSLQIRMVAEDGNIPLIDASQTDRIDFVFDGADQIDSKKTLIKGGGGALLYENVLISMAKKVVIMADASKFVTHLNIPVPVEVYPSARNSVTLFVKRLGGNPSIRLLERGYPFITENGNIILDCNFKTIKQPSLLARKIIRLAGVMEVGIFERKPDIIYKANKHGKFSIIH